MYMLLDEIPNYLIPVGMYIHLLHTYIVRFGLITLVSYLSEFYRIIKKGQLGRYIILMGT